MNQKPRAAKLGGAAVLALSITGCGGSDTSPVETTDLGDESAKGAAAVTYFSDVKPILDAKCTLCHVEGGPAPMALDDPEEVASWAPQIKTEVQARRMPPWYAAEGCNEYHGDRSLSAEQRDIIARWVDAGAAIGDPAAEAPALPADPNDFRADVVVSMPVEYTPSITPDEYRCFFMPWPESEEKFLTGVGLRPGNEALVHHSVIYLATPDSKEALEARDAADPGPGWICFGGSTPAGASTTLVGAIEKAEAGRTFPHGTGLRVEPGSFVIVQQHYNTLATGQPEPDRSSIEFSVEDEVERPGRAFWWMQSTWLAGLMRIPAGDDSATFWHSDEAVADGETPLDIHWADLHMHTLGRSGELVVERADGSEECLLRIDEWQFEWQETYLLKNPVRVYPGDRIRLVCTFDNSPGNQYIVDGERLPAIDVSWGDGSRDEMCLGNFLVSDAPE